MSAYVEQKLLEAGVKNLKAFGYPSVTTKNILTDEIYKAFFLNMLKDNLGNGKDIDKAINKLIAAAALSAPPKEHHD